MIKVVIIGICGRMGHEIGNLVYHTDDMEIVGGIEASGHPSIGKDIGDILNLPDELGIEVISCNNNDRVSRLLEFADVVIDFTNRESTMAMIDLLAIKKVPVVIGSTGLSENDLAYIKEYGARMPILQSFNMSLGMNLMFALSEKVAGILRSYDTEILEKHHKMKKDAPSGSAISLGKAIAKGRNIPFEENAVFSRFGMIGERKKDSIGFQVVRGGSIVGEHTVSFIGDKEIFELHHGALSRTVFAEGAVAAAHWLVKQKPGFYSMKDMLEL